MVIKYKNIKIVCVLTFHEEFTLKAFITYVILFFSIHLESYVKIICTQFPIMQQRSVKS